MILYIDCVGGVAGDMLLGALLDAGAIADEVRTALAATVIAGLDVRLERVERHGATGYRLDQPPRQSRWKTSSSRRWNPVDGSLGVRREPGERGADMVDSDFGCGKLGTF